MNAAHRTVALAACRILDLPVSELWLDTVGLGGTATVFDLREFLGGRADLPAAEYDVVAQALNERFMANGEDHPVPYSDADP